MAGCVGLASTCFPPSDSGSDWWGWTDGTDELLERGVPEERWVGYLVPSGDSLTWYPPTQGAPIRVDGPLS